MRVPPRLRTLLVCTMLEFAALIGTPMRPDEIEKLMRSMNQPQLARVIPDEAPDARPPNLLTSCYVFPIEANCDRPTSPVLPFSCSRLNRAGIQCRMPKLTVDGYGTFDVPDNKRLVLAIEQDAKVDILHACGGNARCTTCRVEFIDGEPAAMTAAEKERLEQRGLSGVRLSCQIVCDHDMSVRAISRLEGSGRPDPGRTPEETIQPPPVWT